MGQVLLGKQQEQDSFFLKQSLREDGGSYGHWGDNTGMLPGHLQEYECIFMFKISLAQHMHV